MMKIDPTTIRKDFPILNQRVNDEPLIYLDNAATTQKPISVLERVAAFYQHDNANVHRGVHTLANRATIAYENSRDTVKDFIHASKRQEVIFTKGTTQSLNWVAKGFASKILKPGDNIVVSPMEHHSNLVPWQQVAHETGANLVYLPMTKDGRIDLEAFKHALGPKDKLLAITHASNVLGTVNPIRKLADVMHQNKGYIVVDGAQAVPHMPVDVTDLNCDFYCFSGHKMLAPTGIGILYGKFDLLDQLTPQEFGGEMIQTVGDFQSTFADLPYRLEGGTPNISGAVGLKAAIDYLQSVGMTEIASYEKKLTDVVLPVLKTIPGIEVYGPDQRTSVFSFNITGIHPHDVATAFDMEGIAVRAGHHCAQPLMRHLGIDSSVRASFYFYNTPAEAKHFLETIPVVKEFFGNGLI